MTPTQISDQLTAIHTALVEKTGEQPFLSISMDVAGGGCDIILYRGYNGGDYVLGKAKAETFAGCIAEAFRIIAELPSPEEAAIRAHADGLAALIDKARDTGVPDEYVTPLRAVRAAIYENLLPAPVTA